MEKGKSRGKQIFGVIGVIFAEGDEGGREKQGQEILKKENNI